MVIVKDQYPNLVYPNMCIKQPTCETFGSIGHQSVQKIMKEKTLLLHSVRFQMPKKGFAHEAFLSDAANFPLERSYRHWTLLVITQNNC